MQEELSALGIVDQNKRCRKGLFCQLSGDNAQA